VSVEADWTEWRDMVRYYPSGVHRRRLIADWLGALEPATLLDVGCGPGDTLEGLSRRLPRTRFCGVDQSPAMIADDRRRLPWCRFEVLDIAAARLPERFDAVVCSEVLEHVDDDEAALANLVAMTGERLLLTVPAGPLYPLERGFGHRRHYQLAELCRRIERHGLGVERAEAWGFPWMSLFKRAANLSPRATRASFAAGPWGPPQKLLGGALTALFYLNLAKKGPQLLVLARR
jgi:SAM-dependent methyltransferase